MKLAKIKFYGLRFSWKAKNGYALGFRESGVELWKDKKLLKFKPMHCVKEILFEEK